MFAINHLRSRCRQDQFQKRGQCEYLSKEITEGSFIYYGMHLFGEGGEVYVTVFVTYQIFELKYLIPLQTLVPVAICKALRIFFKGNVSRDVFKRFLVKYE